MNADVRPDQFTEMMNDVRVPCERELRDAYHAANGQRVLANCGGVNPAEWVMWFACPCPPAYALYCTFCKDTVLAAPMLYCGDCGLNVPPGQMYRLIEPINRSMA